MHQPCYPLFPSPTLFRSKPVRERRGPCRLERKGRGVAAWCEPPPSLVRALDQQRVASRRPAEGVHRAAVEQLRSEEHTSELQSLTNLVCRLLLEKKNIKY